MRRRTAPDARVAFGNAVRERRLLAELSQEELADLSGLHRTYVGGIERGERNVGLLNMVRIASALQTSLSTLVATMEAGLSEKPPSSPPLRPSRGRGER